MVTTVQPRQRVSLKDAKSFSAFTNLVKTQERQKEVRQRLTAQLQTTLDVEKLLNIFYREIQQVVQVGGIVYQTNDTDHLSISMGQQNTHRCTYQLSSETESMGEITLSRSKRFIEEELTILEGLFSTLYFPLKNSLTYRAAITAARKDPLTNTWNRAAMDETLSREVELSKRHNLPMSILMLDLDHFKSVNDRFGHSAGDQALKDTVNIIKDVCRQTDLLFRYGGEEFLLVLNKTDHNGAQIIAERIRKKIEQHSVKCGESDIEVTVSIGVASCRNTDKTEELVCRADKALYQAKVSGRNQIKSGE
ncbi:GGDEF domain-containing protein [Litoribacillus peritrichatus]|uniref:diguanylate cyclase n=1 Tax=Litoribacillus peritrichatus TaxID=718191 RepID=A0ABP7MDK7_9GAMM